MPFEVTPFLPYLTRKNATPVAPTAGTANTAQVAQPVTAMPVTGDAETTPQAAPAATPQN
jgi:hypothetical protein